MLCRVYQKPDGSVVVLRPNRRYKRAEETEVQFIARIAEQDAPKCGLEGLSFCDMDSDCLPTRRQRKEWGVDIPKGEVKVKAK